MKPFKILLGGCLILASCQGAPNREAAEVAAATSTESAASISGLTGDSVKLVTTGSLDLQVRDVDSFTRFALHLATDLGGAVVRQELTYVPVAHQEHTLSVDSTLVIEALEPQAALTIRVPSSKVDSFLFAATDKSLFPVSRLVETEDASLRYLENRLKSQNRAEVPAAGELTKTSLRDHINTRDEGIEQTIANRQIDADVRYSLLQLKLTQNPVVRRTTIANTHIDDYRLPVGARITQAFSSGLRYFTDFLFGLLHMWLFIVVGIAGFLLLRHFRRSKSVILPALKP